MKKTTGFFFITTLIFLLSGCSIGDVIDRFVPVNDSSRQPENSETKTEVSARVYIDEIRGTLTNFTGSEVTLLKDSDVYTFDVSTATIECQAGMVSGDAVSVIYEGQLDGTDTDSVRALKVVSTDKDTDVLQDQTLHGQVTNMTVNTLTLKTDDNRTVFLPSTGVTQYYQNGIKSGSYVYIHYKGNLTASTDSANVQSGRLANVISISDVDPLVIAEPTPTPVPTPETEVKPEGNFRGVIQGAALNSLNVSIENTSNLITLDMSAIPCYFSGGLAPGSHVTVFYTGTFNGTTMEGITLTGITGEEPESLRDSSINYTYTGTITGSTANTMTVVTAEDLQLTCYIDDAANSSTGGLLTGSYVSVTFNPAASRDSNIFTAIEIKDA